MVERSIKEISKELQPTFDLESLSIQLSGENKRVVELFSSLEKTIFGDGPLQTGSIEIKDEAKDKTFKDILVQATQLLLQETSNLQDHLKYVAEEQQLAKLETRDPALTTADVAGFSETSVENAQQVLEQLTSYAYGILFEYVRGGLLNEQEIEDLGFGMETVDAIRNLLREEEKDKFEKWQESAQQELAGLEKALEIAIKDDEDLERAITDLEKLLASSKNSFSKEKGDRGDYLQSNYWGPAEQKIQEWRDRNADYQEREAQRKLAEERQKNIEDFQKEIEQLETLLKEIPAAGEEIWELREAGGFPKFMDLANSLKERRRSIQAEWARLEDAGLVTKKPASFSGAEEINNRIETIRARYSDLMSKLDKYVESAERPPVGKMTKEEIAIEIEKENWDPFIWHEQKFQQAGRMKDVVQAYKDFAFGKESDPKEEIDRVVQKVRIQLHTWDNKGIHETGKASTHRGIMKEEFENRQFARQEIMIASTYHPEWGEEVRKILEFTTKVPALRKGEFLIRRNGELIAVGENRETKTYKFEDGDEFVMVKKENRENEDDMDYEIFEYKTVVNSEEAIEEAKNDPFVLYQSGNFTYEELASDRGRDILSGIVDERFKDYHKEARWFAKKLFTSMDMLTIPLTQLQLRTKTRSHNGAIGGRDYIALYNPLAAYVHRSERYGGVEADWMGWWLYFLKDFGHTDRFGRPIADGEKRDFSAKYLEEKQKLVKRHQGVYFDGSGSESQIDHIGFNESYFPHTYQALYLQEAPLRRILNEDGVEEFKEAGEILEIGDKFVDWRGKVTGKKDDEKMSQNLRGYDLYFVAEDGWEKMLELTFKKIDNELDYEHILEELSEGGKGGILSDFMGSGAGKAKMFHGEHLKSAFKPLLLHLIRRIFALYKGRGKQAELRLFEGVMKSLEDSKSGGLESFSKEIDEVIAELKGPLYGKMSESLKKRERGHRQKETKEYMELWYEEELGEKPPRDVGGYGIVLDGNHQKENYLRVLRNDPDGRIPMPLTRQGDLIQKHE